MRGNFNSLVIEAVDFPTGFRLDELGSQLLDFQDGSCAFVQYRLFDAFAHGSCVWQVLMASTHGIYPFMFAIKAHISNI